MRDPADAFADADLAEVTALVRRVSERADLLTTALGLPTETKYEVLATFGDEIRPALARPVPEIASQQVVRPPTLAMLDEALPRLVELIDSLLRARLEEHLAQLRQSLQSGGFTPAPAPAFGWRNAPAGDDEDIWATPTAQSAHHAADTDALLREVRVLLDELSQDPRIPEADFVQALLFVRTELRELRRQG